MPVMRHLVRPYARGISGAFLDPYSTGAIPPPSYSGAASSAGIRVTSDTALSLIDAYACISLIVDDMVQLPLQTFRRGDEKRTPIDPPAIIADPDPEIEAWEWVGRIVASMATAGNAYGYLYDRDRRGYPQRCTILHPDDVEPRRNRKTGQREYLIRSSRMGSDTLPASEVLHIPWLVMPNGLKGLSPIAASQRGLGLALATEEFGSRFFGDGAIPSSVFESEEEISDDEARKVTARWVASQGGRRRPAFLGGKLKWRQVSINPDEAQFLETRKLNTELVARIWRVPPHRIGAIGDHASQGGGKGLEEQDIGYVVHTLGTYITRIERALSSKKISPAGQYEKFNVGALLRGNTRDRYAAYAIGRQWGWLSVNDIRRLEDLPPIDDGDVYLQPLNMIDAGEALKVLMNNQGDQTGGSA